MHPRPLGLLALAILGAPLTAADLPPDKDREIPESARRPVVVKLPPAPPTSPRPRPPKADLPEGMELHVAAAPPLVTHPIMGALDDRGRLFVGDAVGVNWNKKQLEENPPNRILVLEDADGDGAYDQSTVFADRMTFPQGGCWLAGSLYVCSPPGLWKLTDTNGDDVADRREMIVTGFEYTGNAADVHGPWRHPNGRLYWCHGRKGHKVTGKEGTVVHEGLASGIWSCRPDGSDVQWHSLGCGDNPVRVDFTPDGAIIGVQNIYYSQPRGDTLVHWLYGGVYERPDQLKAIEGLPRTLDRMPVMHNFGHVAVSGCCFWKNPPPGNRVPGTLDLLVTHFNTQRVVRMELAPAGATWTARENEFLKLHDPDAHFTDVLEDADGSLLVLDTGGWFRIGCPSSLMAKPDVLGAVYRVKPSRPAPAPAIAAAPTPPWTPGNLRSAVAGLGSPDPAARRRALEWLAMNASGDWRRDDMVDTDAERAGAAMRRMMREDLDPVLEHSLICATQKMRGLAIQLDDLRRESDPKALRRMLAGFLPDDSAGAGAKLAIARERLESPDAALAAAALGIVVAHPDADAAVGPDLLRWLDAPQIPAARLRAIEGFCGALLEKPGAQKLIAGMLAHPAEEVRHSALTILSTARAPVWNEGWSAPLDALAGRQPTPLLLDALKKLKTPRFDARLQSIADDAARPLAIRLKALDSMKGLKLAGETFTLVRGVLTDAGSSAAARIQAAAMLASAALDAEQQAALAPLLAGVGPVELEKLLPVLRKPRDPALARQLATALAGNPVIASQQESVYRTLLSSQPPDIFETIILPALRKAEAASDARKRLLGPLTEKVIARGNAAAGRTIYESGKGTCIACHQIGGKGRIVGPDLSRIGAIRTERDLLESILFPSNTLARDYEAHVIETSDGQTVMGVIRSHTAEGLLVVDVAGQERNIPHAQIVAHTTLTSSLMPLGLDQTLAEKELCDLVAWLRSLK